MDCALVYALHCRKYMQSDQIGRSATSGASQSLVDCALMTCVNTTSDLGINVLRSLIKRAHIILLSRDSELIKQMLGKVSKSLTLSVVITVCYSRQAGSNGTVYANVSLLNVCLTNAVRAIRIGDSNTFSARYGVLLMTLLLPESSTSTFTTPRATVALKSVAASHMQHRL